MRKYLITTCLLALTCLTGLSQTVEQIAFLEKKMDSLKKIIPGLKGIQKVDALNRIVDIYQILDDDNQMQVDSAGPYAKLAYAEAKRIGYKRGLGYSLLKMSYCDILRTELYIDKNAKKEPGAIETIEAQIGQARKIGEELGDNVMIGSSYWLEGRAESAKGNKEKRTPLLLKSISYFKEPIPNKINGTYSELEYELCDRCVKNELRIAHLYMEIIWVQKGSGAANEYINAAISAYQKAGATEELGDVYMRLARSLGVRNDAAVGIAYFKKAAAIFHDAGNDDDELSATTMICASYYAMGDFENGLEYIKRSVQLVEKLSSKKKQVNLKKNNEWGKAYYWMARIYSAAGDHETALSLMRKAYSYYEDKPEIMNAWASSIGEMYRLKGDHDSAMHYLARFEHMPGSPLGKLYLGRLFISLGQYDKALPIIGQMIEADKKNENAGNLGGAYTDLAKILFGKKDYQSALTNAKAGFTLISKTKRNERLIDSYLLIADIFNKLGKNDSAYYYLKQHALIKDSLLNRQFLIRLNDYKRQADEERKTSQINLLNKDNQIKQQELNQQADIKNGLIIVLILILLLGIFVLRSILLKRRNEKLKMQQNFATQKLDSEMKQAELEMQALRAQMNPHFIFNCLSSINRFILKNEPDTASDYLTRFSRLIRMVLVNSQRSLITLENELEMLTIYLDMERLRFKNSFDYHILFTNRLETGAINIPPLLLQPFCENAIWHGLRHLADPQSGRQEPGRLDISMHMENNILHCTITDNGIGRQQAAAIRSKSAEEKKSLGLKITSERLALLNGKKESDTSYEIIDLKDEHGNAAGTTVKLRISLIEPVEEFA